jgi:hypothetical protein
MQKGKQKFEIQLFEWFIQFDTNIILPRTLISANI